MISQILLNRSLADVCSDRGNSPIMNHTYIFISIKSQNFSVMNYSLKQKLVLRELPYCVLKKALQKLLSHGVLIPCNCNNSVGPKMYSYLKKA